MRVQLRSVILTAVLAAAVTDGRLVAGGAAALPQGWTDADVGSVVALGNASYSSGTFTVQGSGVDVWGTADAFNYVYQPLAGDGTIVARVATISNEANWVKAGVMIRGSLSASSAQAFMLVSNAKGVAFQRRVSDDNTSVSTAGSLSTAPRWVKLVRAGNLITGYESADGASWTVVGSDNFMFGQDVLVGLAVSSHLAGTLSTATFNNVALTNSGGTTNKPPVVSLTAPTSGAVFTAPATVSLAATANDSDGTVTNVAFYANSALIGTATGTPYAMTWSAVPPGTYTLAAVATDNAGATTTSGPVSVTVQAAQGSLPPAWQNTDVGATGAAGNSSDSSGTFMLQGAGADVWGTADALQYAYLPMSGDGSITARVATISGQAAWVKAGVMIRGSLSPSSAQAFMLTSISKGMAFQRRTSDGSLTVSTSGSMSTAPQWVKLTRAGDLVTAYQSPDGATWTVVGSDTFATMPANVLVGLAVSSHIYGTLATATFDNVTTTAMPNQAPSVSLTSPANSASFTAPATITITASASDPQNQLTKVEFYNGTTLLGSDSAAPYSFTWSSVPAGTYSLTAVAYDGAGLNTRSATVSVTVGTTNQPPSVGITSPLNGASFIAPATIAITANASDPKNQLTKVEFYSGSTLLGTDTTAPYSLTWSSVPAGTYLLTAIAYDTAGLKTQSAAVSVTVSISSGPPTGVSFTASTDNATVTSYRIDVFAASANPNTATPVASFNAGKPTPDVSNTITVSASSFFSALAPGNYQLTVTAINANGIGRSSPIAFTR